MKLKIFAIISTFIFSFGLFANVFAIESNSKPSKAQVQYMNEQIFKERILTLLNKIDKKLEKRILEYLEKKDKNFNKKNLIYKKIILLKYKIIIWNKILAKLKAKYNNANTNTKLLIVISLININIENWKDDLKKYEVAYEIYKRNLKKQNEKSRTTENKIKQTPKITKTETNQTLKEKTDFIKFNYEQQKLDAFIKEIEKDLKNYKVFSKGYKIESLKNFLNKKLIVGGKDTIYTNGLDGKLTITKNRIMGFYRYYNEDLILNPLNYIIVKLGKINKPLTELKEYIKENYIDYFRNSIGIKDKKLIFFIDKKTDGNV